MEAITIINSASLAKHADCVPRDEALLTRLHDKFVVRTEDKLREHFAGAIAAARARGLAPVFNFEPGVNLKLPARTGPSVPASPPSPLFGSYTHARHRPRADQSAAQLNHRAREAAGARAQEELRRRRAGGH